MSYDIFKVREYILHLLVSQTCVQGQCNLILKLVVGIGVVVDVEAQILIGCHHWEWLIVHVGGNSTLCHLDDNLIYLLSRLTCKANDVEVVA